MRARATAAADASNILLRRIGFTTPDGPVVLVTDAGATVLALPPRVPRLDGAHAAAVLRPLFLQFSVPGRQNDARRVADLLAAVDAADRSPASAQAIANAAVYVGFSVVDAGAVL